MSQLLDQQKSPPAASPAQEVSGLVDYDGTPGGFLSTLLESQCRLAGALAGAIFRIESGAMARPIKVIPPIGPRSSTPSWLASAAAAAPAIAASRRCHVHPTEVGPDLTGRVIHPHLVLVPVTGGVGRMVTAYLVDAEAGSATLARCCGQLESTSGLLGLYQVHLSLQARDHIIERLRTAMEVLETVNEQERFRAAAMSLCNEVAAAWQAERVTLGLLDGRYVKTTAISHTERFDRRMQLVQDLESTMEECLDQDTEVILPRPDSAIYVTRSAEQLSLRHGPLAVASLPLRRHGRAFAVMTVERRVDAPLSPEEVEILRLTAEVVAPRLLELHRHDRWIGARAASALCESAAALVGPTHTGKKLSAVLAFGVVLFLCLAKGEDRVQCSFEISAVNQRVIPAPFDGRILSVQRDAGDTARAGETVLATLDTVELQMKLAAARAERASYLKEADLALRDGKTVELQMAEARLRRVEADMHLLEHEIGQATIVAPIDGTIVTGDLARKVGAPVKTGEVLFEIAQLEGLRAELLLPEDRISELMDGHGAWRSQRGELASVSHPDDHIPFQVERVNPVAEVIEKHNVFRVQVRLLEQRPWLRPGMRGLAKVPVGKRSYASLFTRGFVNWLRLRLWV